MLNDQKINRIQRQGMPEPNIIGYCEQCKEPINPAYEYCKIEDELFCDSRCFGKCQGLRRIG